MKYIGDPLNTIKLFNEKEVDELCILDIGVTRNKKDINYSLLNEISSECFVPLSYGGGITSVNEAGKVLKLGYEKIIINTSFHNNPSLFTEISNEFGSQSVVGSIDIKKNLFNKYHVVTSCGYISTKLDPLDIAKAMEQNGAGEIILNSINRDGMMNGYELEMFGEIASSLTIPTVFVGGASSILDFRSAVLGGASAVGAGSLFVYKGPHRAVLINYPSERDMDLI